MSENLNLTDLSEMEGKYLTFLMGKQTMGISIAYVMQIVSMQPATPIPEAPAYCKGIINLRGNIIPLIDFNIRLNQAETEYTERTCIIICNVGGSDFGFIVDEVDAVIDIADDMISAPPKMNDYASESYLIGVARVKTAAAEKLVLLIDSARILGEQEITMLTSYT